MNTLESFQNALLKRYRNVRFRRHLVYSLLAASAAGIALTVFYIVFPVTFHPSYGVWGALAAGVLYAGIRSRVERVDTKALIARADIRGGYRSRVTTALDLADKDSESPFREVITNEAQSSIKNADIKDLVPSNMPKGTRWLPLFLLALIALNLISMAYVYRSPDEEVRQAGELLEDFGTTLAAEAEERDLSEAWRIAQEMERLGRLLQERRLNQERVEQRLSELRREIDQQMSGISRQEMPDSAQRDDVAESTSESETDSAGEGGQSGASGLDQQAVEQLRDDLLRQGELTDEEADFLEEAAEAAGNPQDADSFAGDAQDRLDELSERNRRTQESSALESAERTVREAQRSFNQPPEGNRDGGDGTGGDSLTLGEEDSSAGGGAGDGEGDTPAGGDSDTGGTSRNAGDIAVDDETTDDFQRSADENASMMGELDGVVSSRDEIIKTLVRNLPEETESLLRTEEVAVEYVRQVENAIAQETIPVGMRNLMKEYFLRIGLREGDE